MTLQPHYEAAVAHTLSQLPLGVRDEALQYVLSRIRPILQLEMTDVRRACNAALAKYNS